MTFSRNIKKYIEKLYFHREKIRWKTPENWKLKNPIQEPDSKVIVNFIVPLISKERARTWDVVCRNLQRTLWSLERQTSDKWIVTICGQDRPEGVGFSEQIKFLKFPLPSENLDKGDKQEKIRYLIRNISKNRIDSYIFYLDADDILHPNLVSHITSRNNGHGYVLEKGYLVDLLHKKAVPYGFNENKDEPIYIYNGSVTALRFDTRQNRNAVFPAMMRTPHMDAHVRLRKFGFFLEGVPFPSVLYVFNHGENLETARSKDQSKKENLEQAITGDHNFECVVREFKLGVDDLY